MTNPQNYLKGGDGEILLPIRVVDCRQVDRQKKAGGKCVDMICMISKLIFALKELRGIVKPILLVCKIPFPQVRKRKGTEADLGYCQNCTWVQF